MMTNQRDFGFGRIEVNLRSTLNRVEHLDAISRTRALTEAESRSLQEAIRRLNRNAAGRTKRAIQRPWFRTDDLELVALLVEGHKPRRIAVTVNRTEPAVWRRMNKLGLKVRDIAKGSIPRGKVGE